MVLIRFPDDAAPCTLFKVDCRKLERLFELLASCEENSELKLFCKASSGEPELLLDDALENGSIESVPPLPLAEANMDACALATLLLTW